MTPKQKAFADAYIELGDASKAARAAGYSGRSAQQIGAENLLKPVISEYIRERMDPIENGRIASANEVLEFYSDVMRGTACDGEGIPASFAVRLDAGKELMKRHQAAGTAFAINQKPEDDALTKSLRELAQEMMGDSE